MPRAKLLANLPWNGNQRKQSRKKTIKMKTQIEKKLKRKTSSELVETIIKSKKSEAWLKVSHAISGPARKRVGLNLDEIDKGSKDGETIVVPGKVLGRGELTKKIRVVALDFSESAEEKLKAGKIDYVLLIDEIKKNPEGKGIKVLG